MFRQLFTARFSCGALSLKRFDGLFRVALKLVRLFCCVLLSGARGRSQPSPPAPSQHVRHQDRPGPQAVEAGPHLPPGAPSTLLRGTWPDWLGIPLTAALIGS